MNKQAPEIVISEASLSPEKPKPRVHRFAPRPALIKLKTTESVETDE